MRAQAVYVRAGDGSVSETLPNTTFTLPVRVEGGGGELAALTFKLEWDPAAFSYQGSVPGSFGSVSINDAAASTGTLLVSLFSATAAPASFEAVEVEFKAGPMGGGFYPQVITAGSVTGLDITKRLIPVDASVCAGLLGLAGDATRDGAVNIIDAQQIARLAVGLSVLDPSAAWRLGDVTADGSANIIDAQQVARYTIALPAAPGIGADRGGCWEEVVCGGGIQTWSQVIVVEDSLPVEGFQDYLVATPSGVGVGASIRSPVRWLTLPTTSGTTPFSDVATFYGEPALAPGGATLELVPVSGFATTTYICHVNVIFITPTFHAFPSSVERAVSSGTAATDTVLVMLGGVWGGIEDTGEAEVIFSGTAGWVSASFATIPGGSVVGPAGELIVEWDTGSLAPGQYQADIRVFSPRYSGIPPILIPLDLEVVPPPA